MKIDLCIQTREIYAAVLESQTPASLQRYAEMRDTPEFLNALGLTKPTEKPKVRPTPAPIIKPEVNHEPEMAQPAPAPHRSR